MKLAELYAPIAQNRAKCTACARYCQLQEGQIGLCGMRQNIGGKLYALNYGKVFVGHIDPIEKKPVTHYRPGTRIFSIGTSGCNFLCKYCINYEISQRRKVGGLEVAPAEIPRLAEAQGCQGIAYTYNEPTIFIEFAKDIGVEAHKRGLFNIFVSNGYATPSAVKMMSDFLDCITVDFKGNGERNFVRQYIGIPDSEPIFQTLLDIKRKSNIHTEITDLVVPKVGDDLIAAKKLSKWIYENLGPEMPVHFLRFFPSYKMMDFPETPIETLEAHYKIARDAGLKYVYLGNVPGHPLENTYCPECNRIVIERFSTEISGWNLDGHNNCKYCGAHIPIEGPLAETSKEARFMPAYF
ncbi:MAG: AmmeMemoRadiSam system radical SAM enzyme [Nitrososphaerota archaeon]|nr:AmmeMemoRadiSam system radical SAM enzyme [Nitrososphaerota archaeon]